MSFEEQFHSHWNEGCRLGQQHAWAGAGHAFCRAATVAFEANYFEQAARAWETGGEALRRDDRPAEALQALQAALRFSAQENSAVVAIKLAATAADVGDFVLAKALCQEAARERREDGIGFVALDCYAGMLLATGDVSGLRKAIAELESAPAPLLVGCLFRSAQLARLDGRLAAAELLLHQAKESLDPQSAAAGIAGIEGELAELAELKGEPAIAAERYAAAIAGHGKAERRSLAFRMEAARVRAMVTAGLDAMVQPLDEGIAYAQERNMPILDIDLRLARGMARARHAPQSAVEDLRIAIQAGDKYGLAFRAGRARLEAAKLTVSSDQRAILLSAAIKALNGNRPWYWRAQAQRRPYSHEIRLEIRRQFEDMGMERDADCMTLD